MEASMFSRKERDFLHSVVRDGRESSTEVVAAFPNPIYRRKLAWGIRHKAARALADWELYAEAARVNPKVLPVAGSTDGPTPPLFADPFLTFLRGIRGRRQYGDVRSPAHARPAPPSPAKEER
jgi:hypothetical protein